MKNKILITGPKPFTHYLPFKKAIDEYLFNELKLEKSNIEIITGKLIGTESLAERYAEEHGINLVTFNPNWDILGRRDGTRRSMEMISYATSAVIIWDGLSNSAREIIELAKKVNLPYKIILTSDILKDRKNEVHKFQNYK